MVPFPWESELSGIHQVKGAPKVGWYRRRFTVPKDFPADQRVWLRFGAVDWRADVWVNGRKVAEHEGGYTPFEADISDAVNRETENVLVVRAFDPTDPESADRQAGRLVHAQLGDLADRLARGPAQDLHRRRSRVVTALSSRRFEVEIVRGRFRQVKYHRRPSGRGSRSITARRLPSQFLRRSDATRSQLTLDSKVRDPKLWSPESPNLYDVTLELKSRRRSR